MADTKVFMGPKYNSLIDEDPQFIRVPLDHTEWGARKSVLPGKIDDAVDLKHVK